MNSNEVLKVINEPFFSRKKHLLSPEKYATVQGVSTGIVEQAAKLGVVQLRKHKNKTYIVDLPLDAYNIIRTRQDFEQADEEDINFETKTNNLSNLVSKVFQNSSAVSGKSVSVCEQLKPLAEQEKKAKVYRPTVAVGEPKTAEPEFRATKLRSIMDAVKSMPRLKMVNLILAAAFFASAVGYCLVSIDRNVQSKRLSDTYKNISHLADKYENMKQRAQLYQLDVQNWRLEAQQSKKALDSTANELNHTRKRLYEARKQLEELELYNTEVVKRLNSQPVSISEPTTAER